MRGNDSYVKGTSDWIINLMNNELISWNFLYRALGGKFKKV